MQRRGGSAEDLPSFGKTFNWHYSSGAGAETSQPLFTVRSVCKYSLNIQRRICCNIKFIYSCEEVEHLAPCIVLPTFPSAMVSAVSRELGEELGM